MSVSAGEWVSCADGDIVSSSSPIGSVPLEIIAHIFAHLPPASLGTCQLVCKAWHDVVVDEGSWRVRTRVARVFSLAASWKVLTTALDTARMSTDCIRDILRRDARDSRKEDRDDIVAVRIHCSRFPASVRSHSSRSSSLC